MTPLPYLAAIFIYPIKSLDPVELMRATLLESGAIAHDREFALFDEQGLFVNGKRNAKIHLLRSHFKIQSQLLSLEIQGTSQKAVFHIHEERVALEATLSNYFGKPVTLRQNAISGFPDDTNAKGPTIISTATIEEVASWYPNITVEEMRLRMRANLEIGGVPAFWEDRLFTHEDRCVRFQVGDVLFDGINPCQRCVVPTRDSQTGEATGNFENIFVAKRKETLPPWASTSRFNHFYRLSVNTNVPPSESGKILHQGDKLKILDN